MYETENLKRFLIHHTKKRDGVVVLDAEFGDCSAVFLFTSAYDSRETFRTNYSMHRTRSVFLMEGVLSVLLVSHISMLKALRISDVLVPCFAVPIVTR